MKVSVALWFMPAIVLCLSASAAMLAPATHSLPEQLDINVGGKIVHGWKSDNLDEKPGDGQSEGFLFRPRPEDPDRFEVVAWSADHRENEILASAEGKLTHLIEQARPNGQDPAGFLYSGNDKRQMGGLTGGKRNFKRSLPKRAAASDPDHLPSQSPQAVTCASCSGSCILPWSLFLSTLALLLIVLLVRKTRPYPYNESKDGEA